MSDYHHKRSSETPEYGSENFMSDVGGTAGLILGMSFATIVGLIDIFIQYAIRMIWLPFEKAKELFKSLDWDYFMKISYNTKIGKYSLLIEMQLVKTFSWSCTN